MRMFESAKQITAVCVHLAKVNTLPQEVPGNILKGFTQYSVVELGYIHILLNSANKVRQMRAVTGKWDSKATLVTAVKLCSKTNDVFHSLNLTNKWNIPQGHRADAFGIICFNCDTPDHTSDKCPLPCNEARITKAKEVGATSIGQGCGYGGRGHEHRCSDGPGGRGGDLNNTQGKLGATKGAPATPGTHTSLGDEVEKKKGKWMMNCKSCGWNESYTSKYHGKWD